MVQKRDKRSANSLATFTFLQYSTDDRNGLPLLKHPLKVLSYSGNIMHGATPDSAVEYMRFVVAVELLIYSASSKPGFGL